MNNDFTFLKEICFHTGEDVQLFQMVDVILEWMFFLPIENSEWDVDVVRDGRPNQQLGMYQVTVW